MPSNENKKILAVKVSKKGVTIVFSAEETLKVDEQTFTDFYLYPGKSLTVLEFSKLQSAAEQFKFNQYAFQLLSRGAYTEKQVRDKLYAKGAKRFQVEAIVEKLHQYHLLDDRQFAEDRLRYYHDKGYGERRIRDELIARGVAEVILESLAFPKEKEIDKAQKHLPRLNQKYRGRSFLAKKHLIFQVLSQRGFSASTIGAVIGGVDQPSPEEEQHSLKKAYEKAHERYRVKFKGYRLREKIINYLRQKGYNYSDIKEVLGETHEQMD